MVASATSTDLAFISCAFSFSGSACGGLHHFLRLRLGHSKLSYHHIDRGFLVERCQLLLQFSDPCIGHLTEGWTALSVVGNLVGVPLDGSRL